MDYGQYKAALVVGGLVLSGVLVPAVHYLRSGSLVHENVDKTKGCATPGCWSRPAEDVCKTKECKATAKRILDYMDTSVDKCQNFYKYACGKFLKTAKIEDGKESPSPVTEVSLKSTQQMKTILEKKPKKGDPLCFTTARQLYSLCMDEKKIQTQGLEPIKDFIKKAGGWPVLKPDWDPTGWDISQTILRLRQMGADANSLFKVVIVEENDKLAIHVDNPDLRLPPNVYMHGPEHPFVRHYYDYMVEMAMLLGADKKTAEDDMALVYGLEMHLADAIITPQKIWNFAGERYSIPAAYLESVLPFLNWKTLHGAIPSSHPNSEENFVIYDMNYLHTIGKTALPQFNPRTIMNYMMWYSIFGLTQLLSKKARENEMKFKKELYEINAREPRWRECVRVANKMTYAVSAMYIKEYFSDDVKSAVSDIANRLQEELRLTIKHVDWMDQQTKEKADLKAEKMALNIGFTQNLRLNDLSKVEEKYKMLKIDQNNYFQAYVDLEKWNINRGKNDDELMNDNSGLDDMSGVNVQYINKKNSLHIPASNLQPPYFTAGAPSYVNYATLGHIIGHEMTHGFDEQSRIDGSIAAFLKKSMCMVKQYRGFVDSKTQMSLDGINTLKENIADSGGVKLAYRAYKRLEKTLPPELGLPGLEEFTNDQLFFLATANQQCAAHGTEALRSIISDSKHAPEEFRINGALMNLPEFGAVFDCNPGTVMNPDPKDRCQVW